MIFAVKKLRAVENDVVVAAAWYEDQVPGLGDEFLNEVNTAVETLADNALLYSIRFADIRCIRLRRFRGYGVYYVIKDSEVLVLAVLHGVRRIEKLLSGRKAPS